MRCLSSHRSPIAATALLALLLLLLVATLAPAQIPPVLTGPLQSGPLALTPDGDRLVNVNPDLNSITVFSVASDTPGVLRTVKVGLEPSSVAINPAGNRAFVANAEGGTVSVVDLGLYRVRTTLKVGVEPAGVLVSPNGTQLYVANSASNNVMVFDPVRNKKLFTIDLSPYGNSPRAMALTNDGDTDDQDETLCVAQFFSSIRPGMSKFQEGQDDQREGRVIQIPVASMATTPEIDVCALGPLANTGFNSNGRLVPTSGSNPAVASTNPQTFTTPTGAFPNQLASIGLHPTNGLGYVVSTGASPNGPFRFNSNVQGLLSVFSPTTSTEVTSSQLDPTSRRTAPLNLNQGVNLSTTPAPRFFYSNPTGIAWRPNGTDGWVISQQSNSVVRVTLDLAGTPSIGAPLIAGPSGIVRVDLQAATSGQIPGTAPRGIVINPEGTRAYVFNYTSRSVTTINIENALLPTIAGTARSTPALTEASPAAKILRGAELFFTGRGPDNRMSSEGWSSCGSCHPDGLTDNITWMFAAGPRQTPSLAGSFDRKTARSNQQRIFNWTAIADEMADFEHNTRGVQGGRGLIEDDRELFAIGGAFGSSPSDLPFIDVFNQFTGACESTGASLTTPRREFGTATLDDGRIFIIGGRSGVAPGSPVTGTSSVLEFNPLTNSLSPRGNGFTPRFSLGAAAVRTPLGPRIYAFGGYDNTNGATNPLSLVQEFNPATNVWRTVAPLPTAVAESGAAVAGGINSAEPLQLIHATFGNTGTGASPSLTNQIQRFQPDPAGPGVWSTFTPSGLTARRNHGSVAIVRGTSSRIFNIGGQNSAGTVLGTVDEYLAQSVSGVGSLHTSMPQARALFGISAVQNTQQIYVLGGVNTSGIDQSTVFEYSIGNNGASPGAPGTPSGTWTTRGSLPSARRGLGSGVLRYGAGAHLIPDNSNGRSEDWDAINDYVRTIVRPRRAPVAVSDASARRGRTLFGKVGLLASGMSCATCHGGPLWTRSRVDYPAPPSPDTGLGLGLQRVIGSELRVTKAQPNVLFNVGTFGSGRPNEIRFNPSDISQAFPPLGGNGFNIPSLLDVHATAPYFHHGGASTLEEVFNGAQDSGGESRPHFVSSPTQRRDLINFLLSIDIKTAPFR